MYYYKVTIYYVGTEQPYTFTIDEQELYTFIELIIELMTEHISGLCSFTVIRHYIHKEV